MAKTKTPQKPSKKKEEKLISIPSEETINEGEKLRKKMEKTKTKPGERIPTSGGYKKGGKVKKPKK